MLNYGKNIPIPSQMNVKYAFLNRTLQEEVHVKDLVRYEIQEKYDKVYRINRVIWLVVGTKSVVHKDRVLFSEACIYRCLLKYTLCSCLIFIF